MYDYILGYLALGLVITYYFIRRKEEKKKIKRQKQEEYEMMKNAYKDAITELKKEGE